MVAMRRAIALLLSAAVMAACGCGSSGDTTATTSATTATTTPREAPPRNPLPKLPEVPTATSPGPRPGAQGGGAQLPFATAVFHDAQGMWRNEFDASGIDYSPAKLVIFDQRVNTACGPQTSMAGAFYCPGDAGVYLVPRFFDALAQRFGVTGNLAQGYVVAHEMGHHVQTLLGITQRKSQQDQHDPQGVNGRSVKFELQADCFAGIWARSSYQRGEIGQNDIADALHAAAVVGSDFQQRVAGAAVRPEDWTHGSSAERQHWFTVGFERGTPADCDTFAAG